MLFIKTFYFTDSLSQTLLMVDTTNSSDYTFFNREKMSYFKCSNHWNEKFKMMTFNSNFFSTILFIDIHAYSINYCN